MRSETKKMDHRGSITHAIEDVRRVVESGRCVNSGELRQHALS